MRRSRPRDAGEPDALYRFGMGLIVFGILCAVLPLIGLQHRIVAFLPEQGQAGIAAGCLLVGGILLAFSSPATPAQRAGKSTAIGLLILGIGLAGWAFIRPDAPPQPPQFGGPPPGMPGRTAGRSAAAGPGDVGDESMFTLSNAQAARATGPLGNVPGIGIDFRVDYRGSGRMPPG